MQDHHLPGRQKISCNARPDHTLGQKRPKRPWLPAAKSTTEQGVKFVPVADLNCSAASNPQCATDGGSPTRTVVCIGGSFPTYLPWIRRPSGLRGRPAYGPYDSGYRWMLTAASRITSYTRWGWESIGTWLDATSVTLAFIRFARNRCSSGCMVRSADPTI